MTYINT